MLSSLRLGNFTISSYLTRYLNNFPNPRANLCNAVSVNLDNQKETAPNTKFKGADRTQVIPVEQGIRYIKSSAFKETYGDYLVWQQYRRNHKGLFAPRKTRKTCVRAGIITTGNPCPICRDEYLVLDYRNIELLKQFISPHSGEILSAFKTGLCRKKQLDLVVAIERARDYGFLTFDVPFREYNYNEYYNHLNN